MFTQKMEQLLVRSLDTNVPVTANTTTTATFNLPTGRGKCQRVGVLIATDVIADASNLNMTLLVNGNEVLQNVNCSLFMRSQFSQMAEFDVDNWDEQSVIEVRYSVGAVALTAVTKICVFFGFGKIRAENL